MKKIIAIITMAISITAFANSTILDVFKQNSKTVAIILPAAAGGLMHKYTLELQAELGKILNKTITIEFKPGGDGVVAAMAVANAGRGQTTFFLGGPIQNTTSVDQLNEIIPVIYLGMTPGLFVYPTNKHLPYKNLKEILVASKDRTFNYGITASGSVNPLVQAIITKYGNSKNFQEIPYKSGHQVVLDTIGGHVDFGVFSLPTARTGIEAGKFTPLALISAKRSHSLPNIPTLTELGISIPDESRYYYHVFLSANKNVAAEEVEKVRIGLTNYIKTPAGKDMLKRMDIILAADQVGDPIPLMRHILR